MALGFFRLHVDGIYSTLAVLSISGFLTTGCGFRPDSSLTEDTPPTIQPLIVTMGGYNSCHSETPKKNAESVDQEQVQEQLQALNPDSDELRILANGPLGMGLFKPFKQLTTLLKDKFGVEARYVISCFESGSAASYRTSDAPDELKKVEAKDFPKLISTVMRRGSPVYLIGHSHGGWLSLQNTLALAEEITIDGVFSSDPISRVYCKPPALSGCTSFPTDIDKDKQIAIKGATGYWLNAWQTNTFYLHSGPSDQADENIKINAGHTSLDTHPDFWNKVNAKVTENL